MPAQAFPLMTEVACQLLALFVLVMEDKAARGVTITAEDQQFHLTLYQFLNNDALNGLLQLSWSICGWRDAHFLDSGYALEHFNLAP